MGEDKGELKILGFFFFWKICKIVIPFCLVVVGHIWLMWLRSDILELLNGSNTQQILQNSMNKLANIL